jgi:hypothetical protein
MLKNLLIIMLLISVSGCISQNVQLTPSSPPSWAPTYTPAGWNLTEVNKATDYEYVVSYVSMNENNIELLLEDNIGYTKEEVCQIFQEHRLATDQILTDCEDTNGILIHEIYDTQDKIYIQDALANRFGIQYTSNIKLDTSELIRIVSSMS